MFPDLDFALLDDALPLLLRQDSTAHAAVTAATASAIGPLVEYAFHARAIATLLPPLSALVRCEQRSTLEQVLNLGHFDRLPLVTSHEAHRVEFHWVPSERAGFGALSWVMYVRRLQNAAQRAGFPTRIARGLAGAFVEMADNVLLHSYNTASGLSGYQWSVGSFEYAIIDAGIGVLASLRLSDDYRHLNDAGEALQTALTRGESRFGRGSGHGCGFHQVFLSLASLNGSLRFRSGDHVLTIDGTTPDLSRARLQQLGLEFDGLAVSVVCRPD